MTATSQSVYPSLDQALKLDSENKDVAAYLQYLKSIVITASHLLQISQNSENLSNLTTRQIRKLMKVIAMSVERIESILEHQDQLSGEGNQVDLPPQYDEIMNNSQVYDSCQPNCSNVHNHSPNLSPIQKMPSNLSSRNESFPMPDIIEEFDADSDFSGDKSCSSGCSGNSSGSGSSEAKKLSLMDINKKIPFYSVLRLDEEPSPMEIAIKRNKALIRYYKKRLQNASTASNRVQVTLELQRRLVDNLKSAETEHKKNQEWLKEKHNQTISKIQNVLGNIDQGKESNFHPDPRLQHICSKCIDYEERILSPWPDDLRSSLSKKIDEDHVVYVVDETLNVPEYPLTVWLHEKQQQILDEMRKIILPHEDILRKMTDPNFCIKHSLLDSENSDIAFSTQMNVLLTKVIDEIKDIVEVAASILLLMYQDIGELEDGKTICIYLIQKHMFQTFWRPLMRLYKIANYMDVMKLKHILLKHRENYSEVVKRQMNLDPEMEKICLQGAKQLEEILFSTCPTSKAGKIGAIFNFISNGFTKVHKKMVATDDLLPLITYTFLQCKAAEQLVCEIKSIQCFLEDGDMFGENAFCLATMETVLLSLSTMDILQLRDTLPHPLNSSPS